MAVKFPRPGETTKKGLGDTPAFELRGNRFRISNQSKNVSVGKHGGQGFKDALSPALRDQPMMNDRHTQVAPAAGSVE